MERADRKLEVCSLLIYVMAFGHAAEFKPCMYKTAGVTEVGMCCFVLRTIGITVRSVLYNIISIFCGSFIKIHTVIPSWISTLQFC